MCIYGGVRIRDLSLIFGRYNDGESGKAASFSGRARYCCCTRGMGGARHRGCNKSSMWLQAQACRARDDEEKEEESSGFAR